MTAQKIREKALRIPQFPRALEQHLTHIVLAHHGQLEWGSPKVPMTLEALLVHLIDTVDSRVASWLEFMDRDEQEGSWTETSRLYDRHLWKGPVPTVRNRSPIEGRPARRGKKGKGAGRERERERERERDREKERAGGAKPEMPAFKPLKAFEAEAPTETSGETAPAAAPESAPSSGEQANSGD